MEVSQDRLNGLVEKYATNACTKGELDELLMIIEKEQNKREVEMAFRSYWDKVGVGEEDAIKWDRLFAEMIVDSRVELGIRNEELGKKVEDRSKEIEENIEYSRLHEATTAEGRENIGDSSDHASHVRILWRRIAVAAVLVGLLGFGIWFVSNRYSNDSLRQAQTDITDVKAPGKTRATIRLADGSVVMLDEVGSGELALQGNVKVVKHSDGRISYEVINSDSETGEVVFNTLTNPRGSKVIDMKLSDGSRVWLNAGSSVTYPVAFFGDERKVEITGEAYFEVQKVEDRRQKIEEERKNIPFLVESGGVVTEVLGTQFNVNSYGDDGMIKVTLLEGSVAVKTDRKSEMLKPGEQGQVPRLWIRSGAAPKPLDDGQRGSISVVKNIDVEEVMAWKNGMFSFNRTDVRMIMKQLERWYDVEVVYEGSVENIDFTGGIARKENVSQVLKMLETTGVIDFRIEGKKIMIRRK